MKRNIALTLPIITIVTSVWLIINRLELLDIPSNKNDTYASFEKQKINKRTDIDECEREILINKIDFERKEKRNISKVAYQTQSIVFIIIILQIILFTIILMIPKKI